MKLPPNGSAPSERRESKSGNRRDSMALRFNEFFLDTIFGRLLDSHSDRKVAFRDAV
jgi:hypothetical protein